MIKFNELRVTNDGKNLIIDASVIDVSYLEGVTIKSIKVDTSEHYVECEPSEDYAYTAYEYDSGEKLKNVRCVVPIADIELRSLNNILNNIIYVFVETEGFTPSECVPCGMDVNPSIGTTMYMGNIYNNIMSYIKELGDECTIPQGLIDSILKYKALEASLNTGHYTVANTLYEKLINNKKITTSSSDCGCHG